METLETVTISDDDQLYQEMDLVKERRFSCKFCVIRFETSEELKNHQCVLETRNCPHCPRNFSKSNRVLYDHMRLYHSRLVKDLWLPCSECGKLYPNEKIRKTHVTHVHTQNFKRSQINHALLCETVLEESDPASFLMSPVSITSDPERKASTSSRESAEIPTNEIVTHAQDQLPVEHEIGEDICKPSSDLDLDFFDDFLPWMKN